jgi:hypothetical protein
MASMDRHVLENNFSFQFAVITFLIAFARHPGGTTHAAYLIVPSFVGMVFANPTNA